ncbi:hypothetical protein FJZ48_01810 [Candidatus Uhrbacteria bacterium]|nr:hypothetical protein [Candidatus Uhrbacteria bacterium]
MTVAQKLLRWYDRHGRDLPWRNTRDPYKILVSEIMLHQTQVSRALIFYPRWLKQFPNWKALAKASNTKVIRAWSGLGYNRRALALRDIAKQTMEQGIPSTEQEWLALKGIGPYTAAALAAFSGHEKTLPIDTNIRRVLGRMLLGKPFPQFTDDKRIRSLGMDDWSRITKFYDIPQALFDLANSHCKKRPDCETCPLRQDCLAAKKFLNGTVRVPRQMIKKSIEKIHRNKKYPDRIYRGKILKVINEKKRVSIKSLAQQIDPTYKDRVDRIWLQKMVHRMIKDRLITKDQIV